MLSEVKLESFLRSHGFDDLDSPKMMGCSGLESVTFFLLCDFFFLELYGAVGSLSVGVDPDQFATLWMP